MAEYFAGIKMNLTDGLSWKFNDSVTYNETVRALYSKIKIDNSTIFEVSGCNIEKYIKQGDIEYYGNIGLCVRMTNCVEEITLKSSLDVNVYLVDPKLDVIDLKIMTGDEIFSTGSRYDSK